MNHETCTEPTVGMLVPFARPCSAAERDLKEIKMSPSSVVSTVSSCPVVCRHERQGQIIWNQRGQAKRTHLIPVSDALQRVCIGTLYEQFLRTVVKLHARTWRRSASRTAMIEPTCPCPCPSPATETTVAATAVKCRRAVLGTFTNTKAGSLHRRVNTRSICQMIDDVPQL